MNQPNSSCILYFEELLQINNALAARRTQGTQLDAQQGSFTPPQSPSLSDESMHDQHQDVPYQDPLYDAMDLDQHNGGHEEREGGAEEEQLPATARSPFRVDYPGASQIYGKGTTFMDLFKTDPHSAERQTQPYYPFASREEWEMGSFLLRSNLSMKSIDKFLKLELVSFNLLSNIHHSKSL